jgi:glycosyltransferase involved in cell wall biosynthesis
VVRYGVDVPSIRRYCADTPVEAARSGLGLALDRRVALVMGTVEPRKSQAMIVEAFRRLSEDSPEWTIVFVGGSENQHSRALEGLIEEYRLSERVRVEPITSDTYRWYRSADVLLSASDLESLPRSALEAMAFGVPVLSTSVFGVPELIDDGTNGFLFEPNDVKACAEGMRRVFGMGADELSVVGAAAQAHVEGLYDSRSYVEELTELLRSCAQGTIEPPGPSAGEAGPGVVEA